LPEVHGLQRSLLNKISTNVAVTAKTTMLRLAKTKEAAQH